MKKAHKIINVLTVCITAGLMIASTTVYFVNRPSPANYYSIAKSSYATIKNVDSLETEIESKTDLNFEKMKLLNSGIIKTDGTGSIESLNIDMIVSDPNDSYKVDFQSQSSISSDYQAIVTKSNSTDVGGALIKNYLESISLFNSFNSNSTYQFVFGNATINSAKANENSYLYQDDKLTLINEDIQSVFRYVSIVENENTVEKIFFR